MKEYEQELQELGGMYSDNLKSLEEPGKTREGWVFAEAMRDRVTAFIDKETNEVKSATDADAIELGDLYDLQVEAFVRIEKLEQRLLKLEHLCSSKRA